jgi:hypothetical protein
MDSSKYNSHGNLDIEDTSIDEDILHQLLANHSSSMEDALLWIDHHPSALQHWNSKQELPLHIECNHRCRLAVIAKCIELYPEALFVESDIFGTLPLQILLDNYKTSVEDALFIIQKYPGTLKHQDKYGRLPLHVECADRWRSAIISQCIELYPEALALAGKEGLLPIHYALADNFSSMDIFLMMIEKYPAAIHHQDKYDNLPLHIECQYQCRPLVVCKCIELYPRSLAVTKNTNMLPLHVILRNPASSSSLAELIIDKYPAALHNSDHHGNLPIHIECNSRCRSAIISKCIELYPEALSVSTHTGLIPWTSALSTMNKTRKVGMMKSLSILLSAHPESFYHPPRDPIINKLAMMQDPLWRRMILNLLPSCLSSASHVQSHHDLNWQSRCSLLHLWLQIRLKNDRDYDLHHV